MTFDAKGWFGHEQMVDEGLLAGGKHRAHRLRRGSRCALWDQQPVYLEWTPEFKEGDRV